MLGHHTEKVVLGKYNILATQEDEAAILWKDGQYFIISVDHPDKAIPISEPRAFSIDAYGNYVHPEPIPLNVLSDWRKRAAEVDIPLGIRPWRPKAE